MVNCAHETTMEWGMLVWCLACDRDVSEPVEHARPYAARSTGSLVEFLAAAARP